MSTYEDRFTALEQKIAALSLNSVTTQSDNLAHFAGFNRNVAALNNALSEQEYAIRDVRHEITILVGIVGDQGRDIKAIKGDLSAVKEDMSTVKEDLGTFKEDMNTFKENMNTFKENMNTFKISVDKRFDGVDKRFDGVDKHLESLDKKFDQVLVILSTLTPRPQQEA